MISSPAHSQTYQCLKATCCPLHPKALPSQSSQAFSDIPSNADSNIKAAPAPGAVTYKAPAYNAPDVERGMLTKQKQPLGEEPREFIRYK